MRGLLKVSCQMETETTFRLHMDYRWGIPTLDQDFYERFHVFNSSGSSFPKPRGIDGEEWRPPLQVYQMSKGVGFEAQTLT